MNADCRFESLGSMERCCRRLKRVVMGLTVEGVDLVSSIC